MPVNVLDLWQYYQKTCHTGQEKWHRVMQPFSHPYHLCLIMDRHLLIQYFYSDGPLIRWHPFVVNRPGIFTDIPACSGSSYSLGWWDKADGVIHLLYWVSRTAASEQPSDNFAGLFVDFLVDDWGTVVQSLITTVFTVWISCHTTVCLRTTGQIYIPSPNQKAFVSQAVSQNPNMYKPH